VLDGSSLDPTEVFKDPVDDSFAPGYSKIIQTPMCFSMMQEKIGLQQYPSWSLFVVRTDTTVEGLFRPMRLYHFKDHAVNGWLPVLANHYLREVDGLEDKWP
jgi:hypothetical protein